MKSRLEFASASPEGIKAMLGFERFVQGCGLERSLIELVKIRASQLNGCAYCLHMHTADARAAGETEERIYLLPAWRESPLYTPRERAALEWTEALTLIAETGAPDAAYDELAAAFTPGEQANLSLLIGAINVWNRLAVGFRAQHPVTAPDLAKAG